MPCPPLIDTLERTSAARSAMALGAPRWLGAVTPLGGLGMMLGYPIGNFDSDVKFDVYGFHGGIHAFVGGR